MGTPERSPATRPHGRQGHRERAPGLWPLGPPGDVHCPHRHWHDARASPRFTRRGSRASATGSDAPRRDIPVCGKGNRSGWARRQRQDEQSQNRVLEESDGYREAFRQGQSNGPAKAFDWREPVDERARRRADGGDTRLNWTRTAVPVLALMIGAGGAAAGLMLTARNSNGTPVSSSGSSRQPPASAGRGSGGSAGMMGTGGGMMGGGSEIARGAPGGLVPASRMAALAAQAAHGATRSGQTLIYPTKQVTVVALGAPGNRPGMYWQIDGIDGPQGPTVSVPAGATVTVDFADGDPGHPHGFELTTAAPPYNRMAMMQGGIAAPGAFIMPVPPPKANLWYAATVSFQAPPPGTYHIVCPVPGHAQQGMWATFVVR